MANGQALEMVMFHAFRAKDPAMDAQIAMASHSIQTVYPTAKIVLLANPTGREARLSPGIEVESRDVDMSRIMCERVRLYRDHVRASRSGTKLVFLDTDMLLIRRFDELLAAGADLCFTVRQNVEAPINGGLIIVDTTNHGRVAEFFDRFYAYCASLSPEEQQWDGDQIALRDLLNPPPRRLQKIEHARFGELTLRYAPAQVFNHTPRKLMLALGLFRPGARLLHFKGPRKGRMPVYFRRYLSPTFVALTRFLDRDGRRIA